MEALFAPTEEQEMMRALSRKIAREQIAPIATELDRSVELRSDIVEILGSHGLLGLLVPQQYGGQESNFLGFCLTIEELARVSSTAAVICTAQNLGARLIAVNGNEEQKNKYLPGIAEGKMIYGFALTEPDPAALDLKEATLTYVSERSDYILNGAKYFIVNGDAADVFGVFAKTGFDSSKAGVNGFIIEKTVPGFSIKRSAGMSGSEARYTCEGIFKDCRVAGNTLIGKDGNGMTIIQNMLSEISCSAAARAVGLSLAAVSYSTDYALQRVQFKRPIGHFQAVQSMLAGMATKTEAAKQLLYKAACLVDEGNADAPKFAAMAKYFATDAAMNVTIDAVQVHGGIGYMKDFQVERLMRNAKLSQITEGNNLLQQVLIAKSLLGF